MTDGVAPDPGLRALRIGLVAVVTLVAFESLAVITILPEIEADLGGVAWYGWVTTAFFLGTMLGIVYAGEQADRRGAGRPYLGGLVLFAIGLLAAGLAPSMPMLVAARFVQGFGAGVVPAIGYIAIGRAFRPDERPRMFAVLSTAWVVPGLVGPVLAERVAEHLHWRWVFLGLLPLVAVAGVLVIPSIRRIGPVTPSSAAIVAAVPWSRRRMIEAARVAAGAATIVAAFNASPWWLAPGLVAGVVVGLGPLRRLTPPGTLRAAPGLPAVVLSRGLLTFAFFGVDTFVPYAVTSGRLRSSFAGSVAVTMTTVAWTAATWVQERWIERTGERFFIRLGDALLVPAVAITAIGAVPDLVPFWFIHAGWTLGGVGMGLAYSAHSQQTLRLASPATYGAATSSLQLFDNLGIALGTGAVGVVVALGDDAGWHPGDGVAWGLTVAGVAALGGLLVARRLAPSPGGGGVAHSIDAAPVPPT